MKGKHAIGSYTNKKPANSSGSDKQFLQLNLINGSIVNGSRQATFFFTFVSAKPFPRKKLETPRIEKKDERILYN